MTDGIENVRKRFDAAEDVAPVDGLAPPDDMPDDRWTGDDGPPPRTPQDGDGGDAPIEAKGALFPTNDSGNGKRFALYCGDEALHVARVGWFRWDSKRWKLDPDGIAVQEIAHRVQDHIAREMPYVKPTKVEKDLFEIEEALEAKVAELRAAADPSAPDAEAQAEKLTEAKTRLTELRKVTWGRGSTRQRHLAFARSAGNSGPLGNMLHEARPELTRDVEDLDADPLTVNTENGILRFGVTDPQDGCGKVAALTREDHARAVSIAGRKRPQFITKMMPVEYDPDAGCPGFHAFLDRIQPDPEMRAFLCRWFGLSMTAMPVQKFLYMYGMGANGKSALATLMRRMLGDYATMVKIESLTGKNRKGGSDATPDLMKLIGARAAITNEPEEGERLQEQKVKEMTGGDSMLVRNLHSDFVEFTPYFKLTFTGNHKLEIRGTDDGIWRRPLLCPFDVQIPEAERDEKLVDKLWLERSGILNWMIDGLLDYLEGGLQEPAQVRDATSEYRRDSDPIGDFLTNCCDIDGSPTRWSSAADLINGCLLYQLENDAAAWQPGTISRHLKARNTKFRHPLTGMTYTRHKRGVWGYSGITLTVDFANRLDAAPRDAKGHPMPPKAETGSSGDWPT